MILQTFRDVSVLILLCSRSQLLDYLIKTMYQDTFYNVKTCCGFSQIFKSNSGVKQGCNLSPILANIYQNDLHNV